MMTELNPAVQDLLDKVNEGFQQPLEIVIGDQESGVLSNANGETMIDDTGHGTIRILDTTNIDYTLSHELVHLLMRELNYPTTGTGVHSTDAEYDDQLRAIAGGLEGGVIHTMVAGWQADNGILTPEVLKQVRAAAEAEMKPEDGTEDDGFLLSRTFEILNALTVLGGPDADVISPWYRQYPHALEIAGNLWRAISVTDITDARGYRAGIVKVFKAFNEELAKMGLGVDLAEFVCVTPVFSARQLRLSLAQLYRLKTTDYISNKPDTTAYLAMGERDDQAAFVLQLSEEESTPEKLQALYNTPIQTIMDTYMIGYSERQ